MAAEEILLKYKADVSDLQAKVSVIEAKIKKTDAAFTEANKNIKHGFEESSKSANLFSEGLEHLGKAIAGAFAVEQIIRFAEESAKAFEKQQATLEQLSFAVTKITGGTKEQVDQLIKSAERLSAQSFFTPDDIARAQAMQAQFGLTTKEIEQLTPKIADLAVRQGVDLQTATDTALRAITGMTRGLKTVGADFKDTGDRVENFNILNEKLAKLEGSAAAALDTVSGAVKNQAKELEVLQETIGAKIAPVLIALKGAALDAANGLLLLLGIGNKKEEVDGLEGLKKEIEGIQASLKLKGANPDDAFQLLTGQRKKDIESASNKIAELFARNKGLSVDQFSKEDQEKLFKLSASRKGAEEDLRNLIPLQEQYNEDLKHQADLSFDVTKATIAQLEAEKKILEGRADVATVDVQNLISKIEARIKFLQELGAKEAEDTRKRLNDQIAATEALRKFTLKSLQDNAKEDNTIRKAQLAEQITDQDARNIAFLESDKQALEEQKKNLIEFRESTADIDQQILENKISIAQQTGKITKAFLDDTLKDIEQNAKDQIEVLSKVKDDPSTKIDEEKEAQHKILDIRKGAVGQSIFLLEQLRDLGIITEQQYTDAVDKLAQDRKLIRQDEINQGLKDDEDAKQKRLKTIQDLQAAYEQLSGAIKEGTDAIFNNQIESLQAQDQANKDFFDKQQEDINNNVEKRLITEGQGERKSAKLKEERAASEKKSNEAVKALKRQQAEIDKGLTIFRLTLQLLEALAQFPPNPFAIVAASVSLGTAIATPVPKFKAGASWVERGRNAMGEDTIPAMLDEGERVVSRTKNIKHWDIYEAIDQGRLNQYVMKNFVTPALKSQQKTFEENKQKTFADNIGQSLIYNGLTYHEADRIRRKGTRITNEESLAKSVAKEIAKEMNAQKYLG